MALRLSEPAQQGQEKPEGARQIKSKELRRRRSALNLVLSGYIKGTPATQSPNCCLPVTIRVSLTRRLNHRQLSKVDGFFSSSTPLFIPFHPPSFLGTDPHGCRSILDDLIIMLSVPMPCDEVRNRTEGKY